MVKFRRSSQFLLQWIGLVGGTMGLLTGFSILSIVEILYFSARFLSKFRKPNRKC